MNRTVIICNNLGVYELLKKLPNDFRLTGLWKLGVMRKISKRHRIIAYFPVFLPKYTFVDTSRNLLKNKNLMKTIVCLKYFAPDCIWKQFFVSNLLQAPSNVIF